MARTDWLKLENRIRATPMDLLKQGIEEGSWEAVAACYTMLTGQVCQTLPTAIIMHGDHKGQIATLKDNTYTVEPSEPLKVQPKRKRGRPKKQTALAPHNPVPTSVDDLSNCVTTAKDPNAKDKIYAKSKRHDTTPRKLEWVDDKTVAAEDIVENRKVPKEILENSRPVIQMIKMRCRGCGVTESVESSVVAALTLPGGYKMRYLCNSCAAGGSEGGPGDDIVDETDGDDDDTE